MERIKLEDHPILAKAHLKIAKLLLLNIFIFAVINAIYGAYSDNIFSQYVGLIFSILLFPMQIMELIAESIYQEAMEKEKAELLKSL